MFMLQKCIKKRGKYMAKQKEGFVERITPQSEDFSRWYTDVIKMADMVDYSDVKGAMVIKQSVRIWS